ncbi:MAG TPA: hypothetical protein VK431_01410 [Nitrosopumilaceae archaeon]|nr:hypothetical protein [Nitrosopumilaceae archaeon]
MIFFSLLGLNFALGAPSLSIHTDKSVYEYGDHLSLIFEVSELTGDQITFQIIDDSGKASSPIPIQITNLKTKIIAPVAFYKTSFKPGAYHIDAKYSGSSANVVFTLVKSDKIAIPSQYKSLVKLWSEGKQATDTNFANVIRDLVQYDIIQIPGLMNQTNSSVHIPAWVKNDAKWWSDDLISDNDFALGIQYLIKAKIMTV